MKDKILIVAAHPDDEVLGCGGTIVKLSSEGNDVYTLILGEGISSRDEKRNRKKRGKEIRELKRQAHRANKGMGVKQVFTHDFPDNRFDAVPLLDIVKVVEKIKNDVKPHMIFTHCKDDLNIDHQITYRAVITAARPLPRETVKEIYSFETSSSTEWNYPLAFSPNVFFDVTDTIDKKIKALKIYKTELRKSPHPRSEEALRATAKRWGSVAGLGYAEAFNLVRTIK